ncbi:GNAT family protein [Schaalia sp. ZJ1691]|uniref:GNAT family N-acetyltransferase n=1 Tax=Schaalia sp. ZJ1691 TaxID=2709404 RepID=UPI001F14B182|nr:GNAT family protein [Schaalia sp. ZJ1691]
MPSWGWRPRPRIWGRPYSQWEYVVTEPAERGFIQPAFMVPPSGSWDPQSLTIRPLIGREHARLDDVRRSDREWLGPWEATLPQGAPEIIPTIAQYQRASDRQQRRGSLLVMGIFADDAIIGQYAVSNVVRGSMSQGLMGYWVLSDWAGRGVGSLGAAIVIDAVIGEAGLHRLEVCVRPENARSLALCRKLGLYEEGVRPRYMNIGGQWADHVAFSIDSESYPDGGLVRSVWGRSIDE